MEGYIGDVRMFGGNFAPRSWAFCAGQLLAISNNSALFSILGTTFGGDGRTTFALPDLRGRVPVSPGTGPGLSTIPLGQRGGSEYVNINQLSMPQHTHTLTKNLNSTWHPTCSDETTGNTSEPEGAVPADGGVNAYASSTDGVHLASSPIMSDVITGDFNALPAGGSNSHNNIMPVLAVNYIIAIYGIYPSRS